MGHEPIARRYPNTLEEDRRHLEGDLENDDLALEATIR